MNKSLWLIGAGGMAVDYVKVLAAQGLDFQVIGRGDVSARICEDQAGCSVFRGGLTAFLQTKPAACSHAIVAVGVDDLAPTVHELLGYGIKRILVEKPGGLSLAEISALRDAADRDEAEVYVAYNRRFYSSVLRTREIIAEDGGVTSFSFEFTELSHRIAPQEMSVRIKEKWFLANSTHVVDLAFHLGGRPAELCSFTAGGLDWHPSASVFGGAGVAAGGALFTYQANWESAGRWGVEICTRAHRLILRPLEKLQIQKRGEFTAEFADLDDVLDTDYKPGLFRQVRNFIDRVTDDLCTLGEQCDKWRMYDRIANYRSA